MGRKKKEIKGNEVQKLAGFGLTNVEIAEFYKVDESTIRKNFSEFLTKGRLIGKIKLRKKQISVAMNGNPAMLIWLGKVYLGQKENEIDNENYEITVKRTVIK